MYTEAEKKAKIKYVTEKTDRFEMHFSKGKKEEYRKKAEEHGMSLTQYIIYLLEKD